MSAAFRRSTRVMITVAAVLPWTTLGLPFHAATSGAGSTYYLHSLPVSAPILVLTLAVAALAVIAWLRKHQTRSWTIATLVISVLLLLASAPFAHEQVLLWDGVDAQGNPIGGMDASGPGWGLVPLLLSALLTFFAGLHQASVTSRWKGKPLDRHHAG